MCAEGFVLVADKVMPPCMGSKTGCEANEAEEQMCIETKSLDQGDAEGNFCDRTVTIFDWDDTLLSSSFLAANGVQVDDEGELPESWKSLLEDLETLVVSLLRDAMLLGEVCIITNAETGWVELSGARFLPGVLEFVTGNNIRVISARSTYEKYFPDSPEDWKIQAFACEVKKLFPTSTVLNVLVLGDSISELQAAHALARDMPKSRVKAVAFQERPSVDQLQRQLSVVLSSFQDIIDYDGSFDVQLVC